MIKFRSTVIVTTTVITAVVVGLFLNSLRESRPIATAKVSKPTSITLPWAQIEHQNSYDQWLVPPREIETIIDGAFTYLKTAAQTEQHSHWQRDITAIISNPGRYVCQVKGVLRDNRRTVQLFFLASDRHPNWREKEIHVMGGGSDYWRATYDFEAKRFESYFINASQ